MRKLILTMGSPAAGKSTFLKDNGLDIYMISPDNLRLIIQPSVIELKDNEINKTINFANEKIVWDMVRSIMERKMILGETIIIDATHSSQKLLNSYKELTSKYRYRISIIDFRSIPLKRIKENNIKRASVLPHRFIPEDVLELIQERIKHLIIPSSMELLTVNEFKKSLEKDKKPFEIKDVQKVNIFGDIHGCGFELEQLLYETEAENKDNFNIFVGDYFDRYPTIANLKDTFIMLERLVNNKNTLLLLGNHEAHCIYFKEYITAKKNLVLHEANQIKSIDDFLNLEKDSEANERKLSRLSQRNKNLGKNIKETKKRLFEIKKLIPKNTLKTFDQLAELFDEKRITKLFSRFAQHSYFKFNDKEYFVCHGGHIELPNTFSNLIDYYKGIGKYGDEKRITELWKENNPEVIQFFGHRNICSVSPDSYKDNNCYLLNGDAERGPSGNIFAASIVNQEIEITKIKSSQDYQDFTWYENTDKKDIDVSDIKKEDINEKNLLNIARKHKGLIVKNTNVDNIYAINFKNSVFKSGEFDTMSIHARGLFVRNLGEEKNYESEIIARGYHKFFNINERENTKTKALKNNKENYPLKVFEKANGYLGILSVYKDLDTNEYKYFISSKTSVNGEYSQRFNTMIKPTLNENIMNFLIENKCSIVFEIIDPVFDPHIEEYQKEELIILDCIKNTIDLNILDIPLTYVCSLFKEELIRPKKEFKNINSGIEFEDFINEMNKVSKLDSDYIEGFVFHNQKTNFMFKLKTDWYKFWKYMRTLKDRLYKEYQKPYELSFYQETEELKLKYLNISRSKVPRISHNLHSTEEFKIFNFMMDLVNERKIKNLKDVGIIYIRKLYNEKVKELQNI